MLGLDPKKVTGGARLKITNRSRVFSANLARHMKNSRNYIVLQGLDHKISIFSMAAVQKLDSGQNCSDLDHGRGGKVGGKKEEVEGNPFLYLPMAETHRGDRNRSRKEAEMVCSSLVHAWYR